MSDERKLYDDTHDGDAAPGQRAHKSGYLFDRQASRRRPAMHLPVRSALWSLCLVVILLGVSCSRTPSENNKENAGQGDRGKPLSAWIKEMEDPDPEKRSKAAWALGDIRPKSPEAVPALIRGLKDPDAKVRVMSAQSLGWLGPIAKNAVPALIDCLKNAKDDSIKWIGAQALGHIGPDAKEAVPILMELVTRDSGVARGNAVVALGQIGPEAKAAVPKLTELLQAGDEQLRNIAAVSLGQIGPDAREAVPALIVLVKGSGSASTSAITALGRIGPDARAAVPLLRDVMNDRSKGAQGRPPPRWVAAAGALGGIDSAEAKPAVPDLIALVRQYRNRPAGDVGSAQMYRSAMDALKAIDSEAAAKEK
jgi:HEAT repeat protein